MTTERYMVTVTDGVPTIEPYAPPFEIESVVLNSVSRSTQFDPLERFDFFDPPRRREGTVVLLANKADECTSRVTISFDDCKIEVEPT